MKWLLVLLLIGCTTTSDGFDKPKKPPVKVTKCPPPHLFGFDNPPNKDDSTNISLAIRRCREKFTTKHCLYRMTKLDTSIYQAICKKTLD